MSMKNNDGIYLPEVQKLVDELKEQPTNTERIEALENALADLSIQTMGVDVDV